MREKTERESEELCAPSESGYPSEQTGTASTTGPSEAAAPERIARIRETLHPTRSGYCAEPIDIDDARFLLSIVERS